MGYQKAWLEYHKKNNEWLFGNTVYFSSGSCIVKRAVEELRIAVKNIYGLNIIHGKISDKALESRKEGILLRISGDGKLGEEGYHIFKKGNMLAVEGNTPVGILYGVFQLLRYLQNDTDLNALDEFKAPDTPLRMLNHWDNMDGFIERGYSGRSLFFRDNHIVINERTIFYCRLLASIGINAIVINNVNVKGPASELITGKYRRPLRKLADIFKSYGIKLYLSINFAAPIEVGGLRTADPCDEGVNCWWRKQAKALFTAVPDIGGFLVKADSEGRPGPFTYERTHAEGANMLADAVKPYGGLVIWRCFVYNCRQDWRDKKTDRARAAYDHFKPLDGEFQDNVILQIKNGPMDFQVREPVSPLFGAMNNTNQIMEVQLAQEYTGQQRDICYLIPMFKEILDFKTHCEASGDRIADIVSGRTYGQKHCGIAAVSNTGDDGNWTGHDLAAANLYGFGRLCFDMSLSPGEIAGEWARLTYGNHPAVIDSIKKILMMSWPAYEKYTSPLGIGWMVNPHHHYGPNVDGYEYDRWGTYHRADHQGIGVDRSSRGTGYASLYNEPNASAYERTESCPEELLLFFHHIPYRYFLSSGKTVIQHIYDTHFEGVENVVKIIELWKMLEKYIDKECFKRVLSRMEDQLTNAKEWRDVVNTYFYRKSGLPDEKGRTIFG